MQQQTEKKKNTFLFREFVLSHYLLYVTPFLNKVSHSKSSFSLRSGFQGAIYDASKFYLFLELFVVFKITCHVKQ